jgi:CNT family concentrative nucleoside transporter
MELAFDILRFILCIFVLCAIAFGFSTNRKAIDWRLIGKAILLQILIAILAFKLSWFAAIFAFVAKLFVKVYSFSLEGSSFIFGPLENIETNGWIFAIQVLPSLIFFSALFSLLYYLRVLPFIINALSWLMRKTLKISGAESLAAAGNVFLGQSETPLLIKPLLPKLTKSEMNSLIVGGFATISGAIMGSASGMLGGTDEALRQTFAEQFLIASILSAPAAIMFAKIMVPETETISDANFKLSKEHIEDKNALDAISTGTFDGVKLAVNVAAMLIVFVALIALINFIINNVIGHYTGMNDGLPFTESFQEKGLTLQYIFGIIFSPIVWLMGVPNQDMMLVGQLVGQKTAINEFYAYEQLSKLIASGALTNSKSIAISTFALCGFTNFSSIGIMIGGITSLAPGKRSQVVELSWRALIAAALACFCTAAMAGLFY